MREKLLSTFLLTMVLVQLPAGVAAAADAEDAPPPPRPPGWTPGLLIGGSAHLIFNHETIGQQQGLNFAMGAVLQAEIAFNEGIHEWTAGLDASLGANLVPGANAITKADDNLDVDTSYRAHLIEQVGVFVSADVSTTMLPSFEFTDQRIDYVVARNDGSTEFYRGRRLQLTEPFLPTTLTQTVGGFANPIKDEQLDLDLQVGLGAQETIANGALAIQDNAATPEVEILELRNTTQIGVAGALDASGTVDEEGILSYELNLDVLMPFSHSLLPAGDDRDLTDLVYIRLKTAVDVELFDFVKLHYQLDVTRQPLLVDQVQVQNTLLVTFFGAWGSKAPVPPPPPPKCNCPDPPK